MVSKRAAVLWILTLVHLGCSVTRRDLAELVSSGSGAGFHVVLITLDTTRADHLGAYGYKGGETPVLDRLAAEGVLFADAVASAPLTLTAHASILTGLDPQNHGVRHNGQYRLESSRSTLAEVLREAGYETAAFVSAFVLDARYGLNQGFDHYDDRVAPAPGETFGGLDSQRTATEVTDAAITWLEATPRQKPIFLWVHYYDPHADYRPPEEFAERFQGRLYDGEIAYMDSQIGRLVTTLEELGEDTLVVVVGDHGESLGEHAEYTHSRLLYEATQHVPLILWSPSLIEGPVVVDDRVVGIIDVFPMVLDILGVGHRGQTDGVSFLRSREYPDRMIYMETLAPYLENGWAPLHGLRRHQDKYILAPKPEYYDLTRDPRELDNLYGKASHEGAIAEMREDLAGRLEGSPSAQAVAAAATEPDPEALKRLQSLGYLSGAGPGRVSRSGDERPDPKDMMPVQNLVIEARALRGEGRREEALGRLEAALEMAPRDLEVLQEAGLTYRELDRLEEAERVLRTYVAIRPNPNINMLLAGILAETGRLFEGEALVREALELEPDHGGVMITLGDLLAEKGDFAEAMRWYNEAKRVDPYRATAVAEKRIVELRTRISGS
jgi:arylsulfatase A-like enzyme